VNVVYGRSIPQLAQAVRERVIERVENLTSLEVTKVNIQVNDVTCLKASSQLVSISARSGLRLRLSAFQHAALRAALSTSAELYASPEAQEKLRGMRPHDAARHRTDEADKLTSEGRRPVAC
jgi:hypothetical protein